MSYVKAGCPVEITVNQPVKPAGTRPVTGRLLGAMHDRGAVLHYRVHLGDGVVLLAPPGWVDPASLCEVTRAGLAAADDESDFVERIEALTKAWADRREAREPEGVA